MLIYALFALMALLVMFFVVSGINEYRFASKKVHEKYGFRIDTKHEIVKCPVTEKTIEWQGQEALYCISFKMDGQIFTAVIPKEEYIQYSVGDSLRIGTDVTTLYAERDSSFSSYANGEDGWKASVSLTGKGYECPMLTIREFSFADVDTYSANKEQRMEEMKEEFLKDKIAAWERDGLCFLFSAVFAAAFFVFVLVSFIMGGIA